MKRRDFLAGAGVASGALLFGAAGRRAAAEETAATAARSQIWQCKKCGTIIEILWPGQRPPEHCGKSMELLDAKTTGKPAASHVPIITKVDGGFTVAVGPKPHPMLKTHWIQWIDLLAGDKTYRQFLNPGDKPEAHFCLDAKEVSARALCNLHGLWKST
jgi:superoxide reductase